MRVPAPPRLGQLVHLFSVNPSAAFGRKNILASLRRRRDPFHSRSILPCASSSDPDSDLVDPKLDVETAPDDRTLVEFRRRSSRDSMSLRTMPEEEEDEDEDEGCAKSECSRGPPTTSSAGTTRSDRSVRLSIIYPLPSAENLLGHDEPPPTPTATTPIESVAPPFCVPALTPPPTHYKRRRGRIVSYEECDPDPDRASIRSNSEPEPESTLRFPF